MSLSISFRSEMVKSKRTSVWYLSGIATVLTPVFSFMSDTASYRIADLKADPWNLFLTGMGGMAFNIMILPFFLMLTCTLLAQLEYKNNTWKQVYVSPQPLLNVFLSKFLHVQLLLLGVVLLSNLFSFVTLYGIHYFVTDLKLSEHSLDWNRYFIFHGRIYLTVLAISAFQFWLGLRFRNFIVPIVIGIGLWLTGMMMLEEYPWVHADKFPYAYPMRNFFPQYPTDRTAILWGSIIYTVLFLVLGYIDFTRKKVKL
jgi:lantibiotic transport system permease protein